MAISGVGQSYYQNNVATTKSTKSVNSMGEKGIISAGIEEEFKLPTGVTKKISCKKTIVADQPMEDN